MTSIISNNPNHNTDAKRDRADIIQWMDDNEIEYYDSMFNMVYQFFIDNYNPNISRCDNIAAAYRKMYEIMKDYYDNGNWVSKISQDECGVCELLYQHRCEWDFDQLDFDMIEHLIQIRNACSPS